jgi:acetyl esterase
MPTCPDKARVFDECAAAYRGYLPHAADRSHPYASPLQSSRLKNLPPALILSADDDPLRDEAEAYGAKLINAGVRTTVRRMRRPASRSRTPATNAPVPAMPCTRLPTSSPASNRGTPRPAADPP